MHCEYALFKTRLFFRNVQAYFDLIHIPILVVYFHFFAKVRFSHFHCTKSWPSIPKKRKKNKKEVPVVGPL